MKDPEDSWSVERNRKGRLWRNWPEHQPGGRGAHSVCWRRGPRVTEDLLSHSLGSPQEGITREAVSFSQCLVLFLPLTAVELLVSTPVMLALGTPLSLHQETQPRECCELVLRLPSRPRDVRASS